MLVGSSEDAGAMLKDVGEVYRESFRTEIFDLEKIFSHFCVSFPFEFRPRKLRFDRLDARRGEWYSE